MTTPTDILSLSVRSFVDATAAKTPTPGGGSVAALVGALAGALARMSLNYSVGKKSLEAHRAELESGLGRLAKASEMMLELVAEDMAAYEALAKYSKLTPEQRIADEDFAAVLTAAIRVPESVGALAVNILDLCEKLFAKTNPFLHSDLVLAAALADAAARGAELNVLANLSMVPDAGEAREIRNRAAAMVAKADATYARVRAKYQAKL
jgi:formiminotetrahydrofolate cyclodeaminase